MPSLSGSYFKKMQYTFLQLTSNTTDILRKLMVKNTTYCSRAYIKQYWYFKRFSSKLNYSKNYFPEFISQNTNTFKKLLSHNIDLFRAWISNSIQNLTKLLPNNSEHVFESFNKHLNRQNISNWKFPSKSEKVSIHTWSKWFYFQPFFSLNHSSLMALWT